MLASWAQRVASGLLGRAGAPEAAHLALGRRGERLAARELRRKGLRVIARNLRTPAGEADLVCEDRRAGVIALVEVKTRIHSPGTAEISAAAGVHPEKRRRLARIARELSRHPRCAGRRVRIDVVTVEFHPGRGARAEVRHYPGAIGGDGTLA